jgi:hypothetical protein
MRGSAGVVGFNLKDGALCVQCDHVFLFPGRATCPSCTSAAWIPLSNFFASRPTGLVALADVLHHAGNGLTVARVVAQRLADEARDLRAEARKVVVAIDDTMDRLRALEQPHPQSTQGAPDARHADAHGR